MNNTRARKSGFLEQTFFLPFGTISKRKFGTQSGFEQPLIRPE